MGHAESREQGTEAHLKALFQDRISKLAELKTRIEEAQKLDANKTVDELYKDGQDLAYYVEERQKLQNAVNDLEARKIENAKNKVMVLKAEEEARIPVGGKVNESGIKITEKAYADLIQEEEEINNEIRALKEVAKEYESNKPERSEEELRAILKGISGSDAIRMATELKSFSEKNMGGEGAIGGILAKMKKQEVFEKGEELRKEVKEEMHA